MAELQKGKYARARDDPFFDGMRRGETAVLNKGSGLDILRKVTRNDVTRSASNVGNRGQKKITVKLSENDVYRLNIFLKARRDDVSAGVPSRFLHAVIGPDCCDVGSVASTIMYAFYLNETFNDDQLCTVPVINMKRSDAHSNVELGWLLDSCFVDQSSLIFIDEIDLSYYELYGSLKLVLVNCSKLPANQEALKDAVVEIFSCREEATPYSSVAAVSIGKEASCCTLIADKFLLTSPEMLVGQGFSRLLLAGILIDTGNLTNLQTTTKDKYMTTLLINGAGRFGCNGLYEILRNKMHDAADARGGEVFRKDIKRLSKSDAADPRVGDVLKKDIKKLSKSDAVDPEVGEVLQKDTKKSSKSDEADHKAEEVLRKDIKKLDTAEPIMGEVLGKDNINLSKSDSLDPRVGEVLRKDIKRWSKSGKPGSPGSRMGNSNMGMSSVGISIGELLTHHSTSAENIRSFQQLEKLHIFLIVSGYYDAEKSFKREILISAESAELMKSLLHFIYSYANVLPLRALRQSGLTSEMRVFEIEKIVSRKTIEKLLEEFNEISK